MKKSLMIIGVGLVAFSLSLAGTYFAMPYIAPDIVAQSQSGSDSLASDSLDQRAKLMALIDSLDSGDPNALFAEQTAVNRLRDSLTTVHDSLYSVRSRTSTLQAQLNELQRRVSSLESTQAKAADISETLTDLDMREMRAVLAPLNLDIYESLYAQTAGRDRTRLLQAMPPDKAAQLVDRIVVRQ
jgi:chromosome segregation ATPase